MPRRPRKQPRASNGVFNTKKSPVPAKKSDGKMKKWVRREDIEGDDEDNFHEARDRILFEGDDVEGDSGDGEEEVFGLGLEEDESEDEAEEEEGPDAADDGDKPPPLKRKKSTKAAPQHKSSSSASDSENSESWGRSKSAYYASNAPLLSGKEGEEDEEEANEMEEREARRLQSRMRDNMVDGDYGLDDVTEGVVEGVDLKAEELISLESSAVPSAPGISLDKVATLRHLEKTSPETLALAREWDDVARDLVRAQDRLDKLESTTPDDLSLGLSHLHHQTLLTYVATLAFYLHLRAAVPTQPSLAQNNSSARVLARLLTLKQALATMEELDIGVSEDEDDEDSSDSDAADLDEELAALDRLVDRRKPAMEEDMSKVWGKGRKRLEDGELEALLEDAHAEVGDTERPRKRSRRKKETSPVMDSHATSNLRKLTSNVQFDLVEPEFIPTAGSTTRARNAGLEAYGEITALSAADDADKKARKRSLRFHTSKIETSARRKEEARDKMGGDDDIPYRERKKEKEARVRREVDKTRGEGGDDLDSEGDVEMEDGNATLTSGKRKRAEEDPSDAEAGEDGYYDLVKRAKQEEKENKKRQYEDARMAERLDIGIEEGASGPRSLTRAILKNKGLTPRRAKSVRNPRVKKRERFEKAKKKVRSQKAVFKGGLAGKPYGGEESGITKVVKSVKL